jgi:IS1 family transposase
MDYNFEPLLSGFFFAPKATLQQCYLIFQHLIGKSLTKGIEGRNCWIRRRQSRLHRKSTTFSKKLIYHVFCFQS